MKAKKILICAAQVPFVYGGAEQHVDSLKEELLKRGHQVDVVRLPFKWNPKSDIIKSALMWRMLDLTEAYDLSKIDLVIATKFPCYLVKHNNKVTWLFHQFRQVYDFHTSKDFREFTNSPEDISIRETIIAMDNNILPESKRIFANSKNVADRLKKFNNIKSTPLYHPPRHYGKYRCDSYGDYILSPSHLERHKRIGLLINAMLYTDRRLRCLITGAGSERNKLESLIRKNNLEKRVQLLGFVEDEKLLELYANCFCVYYAPYDEDYGYVTLEAFLSKKPVVTSDDSGGVLEFAKDRVNGFVLDKNAQKIGKAISALFADKEMCKRLGENGHETVKNINWDSVINELLSAAQ